ncbi:hypothetical protein D3C75_557090 [compost metagenome]
MLVVGRVQGQWFAFAHVGPQFLAQAPAVVGDQRVGRLEDAAGGAVVLLQADHLGVGEVGSVLVNVLDLGTAPAVDRLVVIAHRHQAVTAARQQAQPGVLHGVGILELVHQHVAEASLIVLQQARVVTPQVQGAKQQLGEIDDTGALASLLVGRIDLAHGRQEQVAPRLDMLRAQAFVFLPVDEPLGLACRPFLLVQAQLAHHPLDQALLVVAVEDLEVLHQPCFLPVGPQQAMGQAVEGADPHARRVDAQQLLDPLAHFCRGLVGEGHRQDRVRRCLLHLDQPGNAVHQHSGFTGTGASKHQLTPERGRYGLALGIVEGIQQEGEVVCAHRAILGRGRKWGKPPLYKYSPAACPFIEPMAGARPPLGWPGRQRLSQSPRWCGFRSAANRRHG